MKPETTHSPADRILDRHCPNLSPEERELARERLHSLAKTLVRIAKRHLEEEMAQSAPCQRPQ